MKIRKVSEILKRNKKKDASAKKVQEQTELKPQTAVQEQAELKPQTAVQEQTEYYPQAVVTKQTELMAPAVQNNRQPASVRNVLKELPVLPIRAAGKALGQLKVTRKKLAGKKQNVQNNGIKKKLIYGGTASLLGISITLSGLFGTPDDLIRQETINQLQNTPGVVMMIEDEDAGYDDEDSRKKATTQPKKGFFARIADAAKKLIYKVPVAVRAVVGIPLWAIGYAIIHLLSGLYAIVLAPVLSHIIGYVLCAVILLAVFVLTMKTIFPNAPLKKILRKKNIIRVLIGAAVLKVLDIVLPLFWGDYYRIKYPVMLGAGLIVLAIIILPRIRRRRSRRPASA